MAKRKLGAKQRKLLRRIERVARTAAANRLHGYMDRAVNQDAKLDHLMTQAEKEHFGGVAFLREERGREKGAELHRKTGKHRR